MKYGVVASSGDLKPYLTFWDFHDVKTDSDIWDDDPSMVSVISATVIIDTLQELMDFRSRMDKPIIIGIAHKYDRFDAVNKIEIYDDYRE